jgi:hypothetical protein
MGDARAVVSIRENGEQETRLIDSHPCKSALLSLEIIAVYEDFYYVLTEVLEGPGLSDMEIVPSIQQFGLCLRP